MTTAAYRARVPCQDLGVGVGLRRPHYHDIERSERQPEWVEVLPENYFRYGGRPRRVIVEVRKRMRVITHGVSLSIGGPDPISQRYLDDLARFFEVIDPPWFTDHLCFSKAHGYEYQDLVPVPFNEQTLEHVAERVHQVKCFLGIPFGLENASYYLQMPGSTMTEAEFFRRLLQEADCGMLLDVNNVFVNAGNHGYDAWDFIASMPMDRVIQLHMAGHEILDDGMRFDTHGEPVPDAVWSLYRRLLQTWGPYPTLIEWDHKLPTWERLMDEADEARRIRVEALALWTEGRRAGEPSSAGAHPENVTPTTRYLEEAAAEVDLDRFFDTVSAALDGRTSPAQAGRALAFNELGTRRLAFYREQVHLHAVDILDKLYGDTRDALGRGHFHALSLRYAAEHPMEDYDWNETGRAFPSFLGALSPGDPLHVPAWAPELAQFEWDGFEVHTHPAEEVPPEAPLQLNPTVIWREFAHGVASWSAADEDERAPAPKAGAQAVLVYRHPELLRTRWTEVSPRVLLAMKIASEGLSPDEVASTSGSARSLVEEIVEEARSLGILVGGGAGG